MPEHVDRIKEAFPDCEKAWAYAVMNQRVSIGKWSEGDFVFHQSARFNWDDVLELRVFNNNRELRFIRDEKNVLICRDSKNIQHEEHPDSAYVMYGTEIIKDSDEWIILKEERGGGLFFPRNESLPTKMNEGEAMWLGIRNYLRFTDDLRLVVCDYSFTGFKFGTDENKREVHI